MQNPAALLPIQFAADVSRKQQTMAQALEFFPPTWETQLMFLPPSFNLARPWWRVSQCQTYDPQGQPATGHPLPWQVLAPQSSSACPVGGCPPEVLGYRR